MTDLAIAKLKKELAESKCSSPRAKVVVKHVADTLKSFCAQDAEFAQAVLQNEKTLTDCCESIMKNVGGSISDLEVYRKAVRFYFPGAGVKMTMSIDLCASVSGGDAENPATSKQSGAGRINLDLGDFFR